MSKSDVSSVSFQFPNMFPPLRLVAIALFGLICAAIFASSTKAAEVATEFSDALPAGAKLTKIEVWADSRVNGLVMTTNKGALPLRGQRKGALQTFEIPADDPILQVSEYFADGALARISFYTKGGKTFEHGADLATLKGANVTSTAQRPVGGSEFGGLRGKAGDSLGDLEPIFRKIVVAKAPPQLPGKAPPPLPDKALPALPDKSASPSEKAQAEKTAPPAPAGASHGGPDPFESADLPAGTTSSPIATQTPEGVAIEGVWFDADFKLEKNVKGFDAKGDVTQLNGENAGDEQIVNGNYTTPTVYRFVSRPGGTNKYVVRLYVETPDGALIENEYVSTDGKTYAAVKGVGSPPFDSFEYDTRVEGKKTLRTLYTKLRGASGPQLYPSQRPDADVVYEGTKEDQRSPFLIAHNLPTKQFNFSGYDIGSVDALDLTSHSKGVIFDENVSATDYAERGNYVVPYGLSYVVDGHEATVFSEHEIGSQKEHQTSVSQSVGASAGKKEIGKLGVKVGWSNTSGKSDSSTQMSSYGISRVNKYALVVDHANMSLNPRFRQAVTDLKDGRLSFENFISRFGTHYPYAVTYGAMATTEYRFDGSEYAEWTAKSLDVSVELKAKIRGVDTKTAYEYKSSDESRQGASQSNGVKRYKAIGGSGGWDEGHFSAAEGKEVPVLVDLRPIWRLLSPVHFTDPAIFVKTRKDLQAKVDAYIASLPDPDSRDFRPVVWKLSVANFRCMANYDGHLWVWGNITVGVTGQANWPILKKLELPEDGVKLGCPKPDNGEARAIDYSEVYWTPKARLVDIGLQHAGDLKARRGNSYTVERHPNKNYVTAEMVAAASAAAASKRGATWSNPAISLLAGLEGNFVRGAQGFKPFVSPWGVSTPGGRLTVQRMLDDPDSRGDASVVFDLTVERLAN